jgi:hypothetical protein
LRLAANKVKLQRQPPIIPWYPVILQKRRQSNRLPLVAKVLSLWSSTSRTHDEHTNNRHLDDFAMAADRLVRTKMGT